MTLCLLSGCDQTDIEEQQAPAGSERIVDSDGAAKPEPPTAPETAANESPGKTEAAAEPWSVPPGWKRVETGSSMRVATFEVPHPVDEAGEPIEVAVTRFPGRVGGQLANVNRWRRQMGLPPISEAELDQHAEPLGGPVEDGYWVSLNHQGRTLLAAAVYVPDEDQTWFVKAITPADAAEALAQPLRQFAQSMAPPATASQPDAADTP